MNWKTLRLTIFFKLIFTEVGMNSHVANSGFHPPFILRKIIHFPSPRPHATCCDSFVGKNKHFSTLFHFISDIFSSFTLVPYPQFPFCFVLWFVFGTAGTKVSESKFVQRCASDEVITGKITGKPTSSWEMGNHMDSWGSSSSAWQSSHNSRLIHQMGIMLHTGTTPKKSYTRLAQHLNSLNNPTLLLSTFWICLGREKGKWAGVIDWSKAQTHLS